MKQLQDMSLEELWQLFPIVLKEHSPMYRKWYEEERNSLLLLLKEYNVCRVNHIGSTSVEGLVAKPIVDILLELPDGYGMDAVGGVLGGNGWLLMAADQAAQTLDFNKGYTQNGFEEKVFHLHIKPSGDWDELYFRDYLSGHPAAARQYEALKLALQKRYQYNRDAYTKENAEFVKYYTQKAREEFGGRYIPAGDGNNGHSAG